MVGMSGSVNLADTSRRAGRAARAPTANKPPDMVGTYCNRKPCQPRLKQHTSRHEHRHTVDSVAAGTFNTLRLIRANSRGQCMAQRVGRCGTSW
jgi:hypothetical protein